MKMILLKAIGIWFVLAISAIVIAVFRVKVLLQFIGEQPAHQLGTVLYLIVQSTIICLFIRKIKIDKIKILLRIGIFWFVITIIFEFIFGHYVMGNSWHKLLADYNLFQGRLWVLVLVNNIASPLFWGMYIKKKQI